MDKKGDVSLQEDLIFGLQNLISIEAHAKNSFYMNNEEKWTELNDIIRQIRSRWLQVIVKKENSQIWCISKHLLASIMSLQEVSNRLYSSDDKDLAKQAEEDAGILLGLLLQLNDLKGGNKK